MPGLPFGATMRSMSRESPGHPDHDALGDHLEELAKRLAPMLHDDANGPLDSEAKGSIDDLFQRFHDQMLELADDFLTQERRRGKPGAKGSATPPSLLTELWLRFRKRPVIAQQGKRLFFFVFYDEARRALIDRWRKRQRERNLVVAMPSFGLAENGAEVDYDRIEELLSELAQEEWRAAMVARAYLLGQVMLGESLVTQPVQLAEIAELSGFSLSTIEKDWHYAKCFLRAAIDKGP